MNEKDLYCMAKILQSVLHAPDGHSMFYGCNFCKYKDDCFQGHGKKVADYFDTMRVHLMQATGVDLRYLDTRDRFKDVYKPTK